MTYATCRDAALKLINRYSIGGTAIATTYNGQADYIARIPDLANDAMTLIMTKVYTNETAFTPTLTAWTGDWSYFDLPTGAFKLYSIVDINADSGEFEEITDWNYMTSSRIAIRTADLNSPIYAYCKTPTMLSSPADDTALDIDAINARAVPYYVAAHLMIHDDPQIYAYLLNEFEKLLVSKPTVANVFTVDSYGASDITGVY